MFQYLVAKELSDTLITGVFWLDVWLKAVIPLAVLSVCGMLQRYGWRIVAQLKGVWWSTARMDDAVRIRISNITSNGDVNQLYQDVAAFISLDENAKAFDRIDLQATTVVAQPHTHYMPTYGSKLQMTVKNVQFTISIEHPSTSLDTNGAGKELQTFTIITPSTAEGLLIVESIRELVAIRKQSMQRSTFDWNGDGFAKSDQWERREANTTRTFNTIKLRDGMEVRLKEDVLSFVQGEDDYKRLGVAWHRGYLLHGPPGTGKSSIVLAVANMIEWPIYVMSLDGSESTNKLMGMFRHIPKRSIILFEDVDTVETVRRREVDTKPPPPSNENKTERLFQTTSKDYDRWRLGTLLNLLDGILASPGRIVFMTTNHKEKIDPALIRPGRVDVDVHLQNCNALQVRDIFQAFFPTASLDVAETTPIKDDISPALISGICTKHRGDAMGAKADIHKVAMYDD